MHRHHPAAGALPRPPRRGCDAGVLEGYDRRYDRLVDWVTETEGSFDDTLLAERPGRSTAHRPDLRHRRPLASSLAGLRTERRDRDRRRRRRHRAVPSVARPHAGDARASVHGSRARVRRPEGRSGTVARRPIRRAGGGDEGAWRRARCVRVPRRVGGGRRIRRRPSLRGRPVAARRSRPTAPAFAAGT